MHPENQLCRLTRIVLTTLVLAALSVAAGCQAPRRTVMGTSVQNRPIECLSFGAGGDVVLIMATIHGDEPAGTPLLHRLADELEEHPEWYSRRRVLVLPLTNPDGFMAQTRYNANGVDLNRNFPATNFSASDIHGDAPLMEPESRAIQRFIETMHPRRIVTIHQPLACVDYDGPARDLAEAMGEHTDLPVRQLGGRAGSLGSYAGVNLDIPIITLELPGEASKLSPDQLWKKYGRTLLAAIRYPETIDKLPMTVGQERMTR